MCYQSFCESRCFFPLVLLVGLSVWHETLHFICEMEGGRERAGLPRQHHDVGRERMMRMRASAAGPSNNRPPLMWSRLPGRLKPAAAQSWGVAAEEDWVRERCRGPYSSVGLVAWKSATRHVLPTSPITCCAACVC